MQKKNTGMKKKDPKYIKPWKNGGSNSLGNCGRKPLEEGKRCPQAWGRRKKPSGEKAGACQRRI